MKIFVLFLIGLLLTVQTASDMKTFSANGVSFNYPNGWVLQDDTTSDAQQLNLGRPNNDVQIRVFIHKGRITPEKFPDAKKAFIDPYIAATAKQFVQMGATPEQSPDVTEIGGVKADGVKLAASLGGEAGAARIYWALVGQRVADPSRRRQMQPVRAGQQPSSQTARDLL